MSIVAGRAEELHVFQEISWKNVDKLIDAFINAYGFAPQEMRVSNYGHRKLETEAYAKGIGMFPYELSRYRGITVKTQETFSHDTIELIAFEDKMSESNICDICGGVKNLVYLVEAVPKGAPVTLSAPSKPWGHLCYGHPRGAPKHDGKLDENGHLKVYLFNGPYASHVGIENDHRDPGDEEVLSPKQALSLLSWLEQNRPELTALAEAMDK